MGVEKNIVAIELGSSSVRAIVGQKKADGSLQVVGFEKENAPDSIHKGVVYNIDKTIQAIQNVKKRLEERGRFVIDRVCVGVSGQSLHTLPNSVHRQFDIKVTISDEIVENLLNENRSHAYPGQEILDVVTQEFRVGSNLTHEPVGIMADRIEGYYKNVVARKSLRESVLRCLAGAKLEVTDCFIAPQLLADYILTETEKRSGCALIDFGAETTTVAVFEKNVMRHLVVIPLGGNHITGDIASTFHIEHEEAEKLKLTYGQAYVDETDQEQSNTINISNDRIIEEKKLLDIVEARQQEILANVWEQIKDYSDRLLAGIIFTGGASNIRFLEKAFVQYHHLDHVKIRLLPSATEFTTTLKLDPQTNTLATLVAMLRRSEQECTSERHEPTDLFDQLPEEPAVATSNSTSATGKGVVQTDTKPAEAETVQESVEEPEPTPEPQPEPKPKKPSSFRRFINRVSEALEGLVEDNNTNSKS